MAQIDQWVIELRNRRINRIHQLLNIDWNLYMNNENINHGKALTEEDANNIASETLNAIVSEDEWLGNNDNVLFTQEEIELATNNTNEDELRTPVELSNIKTFEDLHLLRNYMLGNGVTEVMISIKTVFDENNDIIVEGL
jgi:hypothetical protein